MTDKWYNSSIANRVGSAMLIAAIGLGGATFLRGCSESYKTMNQGAAIDQRIKSKLELKEADLNGNGIVDRFYLIGGKVAVVELDGKPVSELYIK